MKKLAVLLMSLWCGTVVAADVNQLKINTVKQIYQSNNGIENHDAYIERFAGRSLKTLWKRLQKSHYSTSDTEASFTCWPSVDFNFSDSKLRDVSLLPNGDVQAQFDKGETVNVKLSCSTNQCLVDDVVDAFGESLKQDIKICLGLSDIEEDKFRASALDSQHRRDIQAMNLIMNMYNNRYYEDDKYLEAHSTPRLLKKLEEAFPYGEDECGKGNVCYGGWEFFRTGAQDYRAEGEECKSYVTDIQPLGNGWYKYVFYDGGYRGITRVKIIEKNGKLYFDDVQ